MAGTTKAKQNSLSCCLNSGEGTKMEQKILHEVVPPRNFLLDYKPVSSVCCEGSEAADMLQGPTGTERQ